MLPILFKIVRIAIYYFSDSSVTLLLFTGVPSMVQDAKQVAVNPADHHAVSKWRDSNKAVSYIYFFSNCRTRQIFIYCAHEATLQQSFKKLTIEFITN